LVIPEQPSFLCLRLARAFAAIPALMLFAFYPIVAVLGVLSMGFQMIASRLIAPHYGTTIVEWVWLISTFLAAFSVGSVLGGWISNRPAAPRQRLQLAMAALGVAGFALTAKFGSGMLDVIEQKFIPIEQMNDQGAAGMNTALFVSCMGLFFVPVTALSSFGPQCVNFLAVRGTAPGAASGIVYGVSTLGNIVGVMLTTFWLIPTFHVSTLMYAWLTVAILSLGILLMIFRHALPRASQPPKP
jgi:MFS family permease